MHPLLLVLGGAAAGALVANTVEAARQRKITDDLARQNALDSSAKTLEQGRAYSVMMRIDPTHPQFGGLRDVGQAAALIKATLEAPGATGGWGFMAPAAPLDEEQRRLFVAGKPSTWAFSAVWTRPEKFVRGRSPGGSRWPSPFSSRRAKPSTWRVATQETQISALGGTPEGGSTGGSIRDPRMPPFQAVHKPRTQRDPTSPEAYDEAAERLLDDASRQSGGS